jgi:hypothetical protein
MSQAQAPLALWNCRHHPIRHAAPFPLIWYIDALPAERSLSVPFDGATIEACGLHAERRKPAAGSAPTASPPRLPERRPSQSPPRGCGDTSPVPLHQPRVAEAHTGIVSIGVNRSSMTRIRRLRRRRDCLRASAQFGSRRSAALKTRNAPGKKDFCFALGKP